MYQIILEPRVKKVLKKINRKDYNRMLLVFFRLSKDPFVGGKLRGKYEGCYAIRVWPYRLLYKVEKGKLIVVIFKIGPRRDVYK